MLLGVGLVSCPDILVGTSVPSECLLYLSLNPQVFLHSTLSQVKKLCQVPSASNAQAHPGADCPQVPACVKAAPGPSSALGLS